MSYPPIVPFRPSYAYFTAASYDRGVYVPLRERPPCKGQRQRTENGKERPSGPDKNIRQEILKILLQRVEKFGRVELHEKTCWPE